jgi:hypothetical protein
MCLWNVGIAGSTGANQKLLQKGFAWALGLRLTEGEQKVTKCTKEEIVEIVNTFLAEAESERAGHAN